MDYRLGPAASTNLIAQVVLLPTIHREGGFQVSFFANDHSRPHVHVIRAGGFAKVAIGNAGEPPRLLEAGRIKDRDIIRAVRIVEVE